jgi:hypothetical protein
MFKQIFVQICLPLLRASPNELETFVHDPQEFVSMNNEALTKSDSGNFKTSAGYLVKRLCRRVEGSLQYIATFSMQVV